MGSFWCFLVVPTVNYMWAQVFNFSNFLFSFLMVTTTPRVAAAAANDNREEVLIHEQWVLHRRRPAHIRLLICLPHRTAGC